MRYVEFVYAAGKKGAFVPERWRDNDESIGYSFEANVDRVAINLDVTPASFEVKAPPGALVSDYITDEFYIQKSTGKRLIAPGEYTGSNYAELLQREGRDGGGSRFSLLCVAGASIALLIIGAAARFYIRRGRSGTTAHRA